MIRFDDILEKAASYIGEKDILALQKAYVFAGKAHRGQVRRSGEPYLSHPLEVAGLLADMRLDRTTLVAALLHDVLEDTEVTVAELRENFGKEVADLVAGVTKIGRVQDVSPEARRAETIRKIILAMTDDIRVIFIKLADRIHNLKTLDALDEERQRQIARETLEIYAPIANRLGMGRIRADLEDLSFRFVEPDEYARVTATIEPLRAAAEASLAAMASTLEALLAENGIPAEVSSRIKRPYSVWSKMRRRGIGFDQVYDFLALRVITDSVKNCYQVLGLIHQRWPHLPQRFRDFIAMPKANFYQALHTTVIPEAKRTIEVQIRTRDMHDLAENGIAAHWRYKEGASGEPMKEDRRLYWLREMAALFREQKDPREFLRDLKMNLVPEEVYVFTPKGKVINLPPGATALDFAFRIHSEVGLRAVSARINGVPLPLKTVLKTGDIVEILTEPDRVPTRALLASATTSSARQHLKRWLNQRSRASAIALGRRLWERQARKFVLPEPLQDEAELARRLADIVCLKSPTLEEFFLQVGLGRIVIGPGLVESVLGAPADHGAKPQEAGRPTSSSVSGGTFRIKELDDPSVRLARCCSPVKGEAVVGYITAGKGMTVHATRCPLVAKELLDGQRLVDVSWDPALSGSFKARLQAVSEDAPGVLAQVAAAVAGLDGNISKAEASSIGEGRARIRLEVVIRDLRHLEAIQAALGGLKSLLSVERL